MHHASIIHAAVISIVSLSLGCGGETPPERHANSLASIDEGQIHAAVAGDDLAIDVPIHRLSEAALSGRLSIDLTDVATGTRTHLTSEIADVEQDEADHAYRLVFAGRGVGFERVDAGPVIIDWRLHLEGDGDDLYGHRSLFDALGNLDVSLRGPTELPVAGDAPVRVVVRDPSTQAPIEGARVEAVLVTPAATEDADPVEHALFTGTTDARGELLDRIALPEGATGGTLRVTVSDEEVEVWTSRLVGRRADDALYLGTDKTIYKPGQDVHLRLLALDALDRAPIADEDVVFEARDGRGNKVFRRSSRTDAFGVAAVSVPTDTRVNEGDWLFTAAIAGRTAQIGVPVEAYALPRMRVSVGIDRTFALPGQTARATIAAQYLFGEPVANASMQLEARSVSGVPVGSFFATTDEQGAATVDVLLPDALASDALEQSGDTLLFTATITDTAGQVERGETALPLAAAPIRIQTIGDATLTAGTENLVYVVVTDAVGQPLVADLEVRGDVDQSLVTNASGVAELRFTPPGDEVALDISATDGAGRTHDRSITLGTSTDPRLVVTSDRAIYQPGDTAHLHLSATGGLTRAYLDVYRGAVGVLSTAVDLTGGGADVELPIDAELGGLLVVDAIARGADGVTHRAAHPVLVERDDNITVALSADRAEYGPGDEAQISVEIADSAGAPRVASVGLTVVDQAVFALGGEPTTSIRTSFGLDGQVLPASVNVAGRNVEDLLATSDPSEREQLARLLFASAGDVDGPSFDYDSLAVEIPAVVSSLLGKVNADATSYLEGLQSSGSGPWGTVTLTIDDIARRVLGARLVDPFGRYYHVDVEGEEDWSRQMVLTSDGPDETAGTRDDVVGRASLSIATYGAYSRGDEADFAAGGGPMAGAPPEAAEAGDPSAGGGEGASPVRTDFRETAYVNPMLITDASGRATVTVPLAQSITTWRVSADASSADGRVGASVRTLRTFQPFFVDFTMPLDLTRGDELDVPAIVYNYTTDPQRVDVTIEADDWFELVGGASESVDLGPSEVRAARFRIRVTGAGTHALTLHGSAGSLSDALVRTVDVQPDGQPDDDVASGRLVPGTPALHSLSIPSDTVPGGAMMELVLTPGFASEAVQGVEALLQEPNGCFEQTTATAWPNTLVAKYLELTGALTPERREEVIGFVTRGYQRLLTFESPTGGFNWWGDADPGNRILSAIMIWHLADMEDLIGTDPEVRDRTLDWLVAQQRPDGSWESGDALHAGNEVLGTDEARTTAFIAWALAHTGWADDAVARAGGWLRSHLPPESDLYANALVANALAMEDPRGAMTGEVFARLDALRVDLGPGEGTLWPTESPSWTGTAGDTAAIETTGLVAYGLINAGVYPDNVAGAMEYILANKDAVGTWYNTQATMNALRALSAALTGGASDATGTLTITVDGAVADTVAVTEDNRDLYRRFDLSHYASVGDHTVRVAFTGTGEVNYRLTRRAFRPVLPDAVGPLSLSVDYDTTTSVVGVPVNVLARATNTETSGARDQVIVRVGRAPGFVPRTEDLDAIVAAGSASRYEVRSDDVTFYLMGLAAGETRELRFRLTPSLPVDATAPAARIYAYYEPSLEQILPTERFVATSR